MNGTWSDDRAFRDAMALFPTGIVAITAIADGAALGMTVGSFFSVSLKPQLVGFCVDQQSASWHRIRDVGRFCVSILAGDQHAVSERLAIRGRPDKLSLVEWDTLEVGMPVIRGALAWVACDIADTHAAGTHTVVIGRVTRLAVSRDERPLIYFRRRYYSITHVATRGDRPKESETR